MHVLILLNDPPYGTERTYNGPRLAPNLPHKAEGASVTVFLMADATAAAKHGQQTPNGYYNLERMLRASWPARGRSCSAAAVWTRAASATTAPRPCPEPTP